MADFQMTQPPASVKYSCQIMVRIALILSLIYTSHIGNLRASDQLDALKNAHPAAGEGLVSISGCHLISTDWADGDSFRVRAPSGEEFTVRLYAVDCIELHIGDETDARRFSEQRRFFGLARPSIEESIAIGREFATQAAAATTRMLSAPFTIHTAYADGKGDGRYRRIYAFVETADGRDLAEELIRLGLARAFGVARRTQRDESRDDYAARLADLELAAAKAGAGVWSATDWSTLVNERTRQRAEASEIRLTLGNEPAPDSPLDLNRAARDELMRIPGIGEVMANRIIEGRPYKSVDDLIDTPGIGRAKLEKFKPYFSVRD